MEHVNFLIDAMRKELSTIDQRLAELRSYGYEIDNPELAVIGGMLGLDGELRALLDNTTAIRVACRALNQQKKR